MVAIVRIAALDQQLYILCALVLAYGIALLLQSVANPTGVFGSVMHDFEAMPYTMRRLVPVQFFSWLALFAMWIYTTAAVTQVHFGATDAQSATYNEGANWVGVLFGAYNGFAALAAAVAELDGGRRAAFAREVVAQWEPFAEHGGLILLLRVVTASARAR